MNLYVGLCVLDGVWGLHTQDVLSALFMIKSTSQGYDPSVAVNGKAPIGCNVSQKLVSHSGTKVNVVGSNLGYNIAWGQIWWDKQQNKSIIHRKTLSSDGFYSELEWSLVKFYSYLLLVNSLS